MATPQQIFHKAVLLLDREQHERGEVCLRDAIAAAAQENDAVTCVAAKCCLGELLLQTGRVAEGAELLREIAALEEGNDLHDYERRRAVELLKSVSNPQRD